MKLKQKLITKLSANFVRGFNEFKDYKPRTNLVKDETGDLVAHSHCTLYR
jgi:hypothetical protein